MPWILWRVFVRWSNSTSMSTTRRCRIQRSVGRRLTRSSLEPAPKCPRNWRSRRAMHGQLAWPPTARCLASAVSGSKHHFLKDKFHCDFRGGAIANKKLLMSSFAAGTKTGARRGYRPAINVGGEELHRIILLARLHALMQEDRDGIGLLAGRASRRPDADHGACGLVCKEFGEALFLKYLEGLRIAEETGYTDQQVTKQRLHLGWRLLQIPDVVVDHVDLVNGHAPFDAAVDRAWLVLGKVVAGLGAQQDEDLLQRALGLGRIDGGGRTGM